MRVLLVVLLLAAIGLLQTDSILLEGSTKQELDIYKAQVRIVYNKLANGCPTYHRWRRQIQEDHPIRLEVVKELYEGLLEKLVKCRELNKEMSFTAKQTNPTTTEQTTPTTTEQTTPAITKHTTTKQTTPITTKQTTPATTEQTTPASTKQTTPITTKQMTPITIKQTTPTTRKRTTPTTSQQTNPTTTEQTNSTTKQTTLTTKQTTPATTEQTTPASTKQTTPITTKQTTPITIKQTTPTTRKRTTPTTSQQTNPTTTEQTNSTTKQTTRTTKQTTPITTKQTTPTTKQITPTTKQTIPTTSNQTTPTMIQPIECQQAINYTQSWRRDYNGANTKPGGPNSEDGYACDIHVSDFHWFRFTGQAGNRMLNRCPKYRSCGARFPYWTDAEMPKVVGVESTVDTYGVSSGNCKAGTVQVKVMRCSRDTEHDFIYKQIYNYSGQYCREAFCGMQ